VPCEANDENSELEGLDTELVLLIDNIKLSVNQLN
jgi:hypothetical protein